MNVQEIQKICSEEKVILDKDLFENVSSINNPLFLKALLEKLKSLSGRSFITNSFLEKNKKEIKFFLDNSSFENLLDKKNFYKLFDFSLDQTPKKEKKTQKRSSVKILSPFHSSGKKIVVKDFVTHFRNRYKEMKSILEERKELENLVSINKLSRDKQKFSIIGLVYSKKVTKNKNIILEVEDLTGKMKVLVSSSKEDLVKESEDIPLDSVIGFKGVGNSDILFVNEIVFPEVHLPERKKGDSEEIALFIGDLHYGSKKFLKKDFLRFIDYLNGKVPNTPEIKKIKYLFIVGDLVTGVGNYPNQEEDLEIQDLEKQFEEIAKILSTIKKEITIILSPGNHDGVRLMEPQPLLDEKFAWPLFEIENLILTENPCILKIGESASFEGFEVLTYHGFSFPYYSNSIPKLMIEKTMNQPEKIMKYLLKMRHLAPTHASTQYFPLEKDGLLIRKSPDIFVSGHTHKSGVSYLNNVLVISVSSWEGKTAYQEKFGNEPDHGKVISFNLKTRAVKVLDFETKEEENEN